MQEEKKSDEQHQINLFIIYAAMAWKFKRNQCWLKLWSALDRFASYTEKKNVLDASQTHNATASSNVDQA